MHFNPKAPIRSKFTACALLVALVSRRTADLYAVTIGWNNTSGGAWSDPANWSPQQVPGLAGDTCLDHQHNRKLHRHR